jgi:hypothetical protein
LNEHLLAPQQVAGHDADLAAAGHQRHVLQLEGTRLDPALQPAAVVDEHLQRRRQHRLTAHRRQRDGQETWRGGEVGAPLDAAEARGAAPAAGLCDGIAHAHRLHALGQVHRPGGVQPQHLRRTFVRAHEAGRLQPAGAGEGAHLRQQAGHLSAAGVVQLGALHEGVVVDKAAALCAIVRAARRGVQRQALAGEGAGPGLQHQRLRRRFEAGAQPWHGVERAVAVTFVVDALGGGRAQAQLGPA